MTRFERLWGHVEDALMAILGTAALLLICYEVVARYFVPSMLFDWGAEVTVYLTVWAMLIAGSPLVAHGRHIRADLIVRQFPENAQKVLEFCNLTIGLVYCGIVGWFGYEVAAFAKMLDFRSESSLQFELWIFYLILPITFGLMTVRYAIQIVRFVFHYDPSMLPSGAHDETPESRIERSQT